MHNPLNTDNPSDSWDVKGVFEKGRSDFQDKVEEEKEKKSEVTAAATAALSLSRTPPHKSAITDTHHKTNIDRLRAKLPEGFTRKQWQPSKLLAESLNKKVAFQILADHWGAGRISKSGERLEGASAHELLAFMGQLTKECYQNNKDEDCYKRLVSHYQKAATLAHMLQEVTSQGFTTFIQESILKNIHSLDLNESLFIPIGWSGLEDAAIYKRHLGHAMLLQIEKIEDKPNPTYKVKILNTGAGLDTFHISKQLSSSSEGPHATYKTKYSPLVEWSSTDAHKLSDVDFWKRLLEPQTVPLWEAAARPYYDQNHIYLTCQSHLGTPKAIDNSTADFISAQRAGTCSKKSTDLISRMLLDPNAYKRFKIDTKLATLSMLLDHWSNPEHPFYGDAEIREFIHKGLEKVTGSIHKASRGTTYAKFREEYYQAIASLCDLSDQFVSKSAQIQNQSSLDDKAYADLASHNFVDKASLERKEIYGKVLQSVSQRSNLSSGLDIVHMGTGPPLPPIAFPKEQSELPSLLEQLRKYVEQESILQTRPPQESMDYLQANVFERLPLITAENNPWRELFSKDIKAAKECLSLLRNLMKSCSIFTGLTGQIDPEHSLQLWKTYRIAIELAEIGEPRLKGQSFNWSYLQQMQSSPRSTSTGDRHCQLSRAIIESFMAHSPMGGQIREVGKDSMSKCSFFEYPYAHTESYYSEEDFYSIPEIGWLSSQVNKEFDIERILNINLALDRELPPVANEYYLLRDMAIFACRGSLCETTTATIKKTIVIHPYFNLSGGKGWYLIRGGGMAPANIHDYWKESYPLVDHDLTSFMQEHFANKKLEQGEIIILNSRRMRDLEGHSALNSQREYGAFVASESQSELSLALIIEQLEAKPELLNEFQYRNYFRLLFSNGEQFIKQFSMQPALFKRWMNFINRELEVHQKGILSPATHIKDTQKFLCLFRLAQTLLLLGRGLPQNKEIKELEEIFESRRNQITKQFLQTLNTPSLSLKEEIVSLWTHYLISSWTSLKSFQDRESPKLLPQNYMALLRLHGRYPLRILPEDPQVVLDVSHVCQYYSTLIARHMHDSEQRTSILKHLLGNDSPIIHAALNDAPEIADIAAKYAKWHEECKQLSSYINMLLANIARGQNRYQQGRISIEELEKTMTRLNRELEMHENQLAHAGKQRGEAAAEFQAKLNPMQWTADFPLYSIKTAQDIVIQVDILQGIVSYQGIDDIGDVLPSSLRESPKLNIFNSILNEPYTHSELAYRPRKEIHRDLCFTSGNPPLVTLDIAYEDDKFTYTYLDENEWRQLPLPQVFRSSTFSYWMTNAKDSQYPITICIHDSQGMPEPAFYMNREGKIISKQNTDLTLIDQNVENKKALLVLQGLCPNLNNALTWSKEDVDKNNHLAKIQIPIDAGDGSWCSFSTRPGKKGLYWDQSPQYHVASTQAVPTLRDYPYRLVIQQDETADMQVLINPLQITTLEGRYNGKKTDCVDLSTTMPPFGAASEKLLIFGMNSIGELTSNSIKGKLYLAYLKLMQDDYFAAIKLLKEAQPIGRFYSSEELQILQWIVDSNRERADRHPGACTTRIIAAWLVYDLHDRFPLTESEIKALDRRCNSYFFSVALPDNRNTKPSCTQTLEEDYYTYTCHSYISKQWQLEEILPAIEELTLTKKLGIASRSYQLLHRQPFLPSINVVRAIPLPPEAYSNDLELQKALFPDEEMLKASPDMLDMWLFESYQTWGGPKFAQLFRHAYDIATGNQGAIKQKLLKALIEKRIMEHERQGLRKLGDLEISDSINQLLYSTLLTAMQMTGCPDLPNIKRAAESELKKREITQQFFDSIIAHKNNASQPVMRDDFNIPYHVDPVITQLPTILQNTFAHLQNGLYLSSRTADAKACEDAIAQINKQRSLLLPTLSDALAKQALQKLDELENYGKQLLNVIGHHMHGTTIDAQYKQEQLQQATGKLSYNIALPQPLNELSAFKNTIRAEKIETHIKERMPLITESERKQLNDRDRDAVAELEKGIKTFDDIKGRIAYSLDIHDLPTMQDTLKNRIKELQENGSKLEREILQWANRLPDDMSADDQMSLLLQRLKGTERSFNIPYCIGLLLQSLPHQWKELIGITEQERDTFRQMLMQYLLFKTEEQHCQRLQEKIDLFPLAKERDRKQLANEIGMLASSQRGYNPTDNPELLIFEYYANIRLFPEQANIIKLLSTKQYCEQVAGIKGKVVQLIMGGGKSKILAPILAFKAADGTHISTITSTEQLYDTGKIDWGESIYTMFGRHCDVLEFNRNECGIEKLQRIKRTLDRARREGRVLIARPNDLIALSLMLPEHLEQRHQGNTAVSQEQIALIQDVLRTLKAYQVNLIDEFDSVCHPLSQLSFPIGEAKPISQLEIDEAITLYYEWLPEIDDLVHIRDNQQSSYHNEESYKKVQEHIIDKVWHTFSEYLTSHDITEDDLREYLIGKDNNAAQKVENALAKDTSGYGKKIAERIAFYKQAITYELKNALESTSHVNYGMSQKEKEFFIAIPYEHSQPKEGSRFKSSHEALIKTCQYYRQNWNNPALTEKLLLYFVDTMIAEVDNPVALSLLAILGVSSFADIKMDDPKAIKEYTTSLSQALHSPSKDIQTEALKIISLFLMRSVIPQQLLLNPVQMTGSSLDLIDTSKVSNGFTGTFANEHTWDQQIKVEDDATTNGATDEVLLDPQNATSTIIDDPKTLEDKVVAFVKMMQQNAHICSLIDLGALFRGESAANIAATFMKEFNANRMNKKAVLACIKNQAGEWQWALWKDAKSPIFIKGSSYDAIKEAYGELTPEQVFTIYDHAHIVGVDIPQPIASRSLVTIGDKTTIETFRQGVNRLRKLGQRVQHIHYMIPKAVSECILREAGNPQQPVEQQQVTSATLLRYSQLLLKKNERMRNYNGIQKQLRQVIKRRIQELLIETDNPTKQQALYSLGRQFYISEQSVNLFSQFGHVEHYSKDAWEQLDNEKNRLIEYLKAGDGAVLGLDIDAMEKTMTSLLADQREKNTPLPDIVSDVAYEADATVQLQTQAQTHLQQNTKLQQNVLEEESVKKGVEPLKAEPEIPWPDLLDDPELFTPLDSIRSEKSRRLGPSIYRLNNCLPPQYTDEMRPLLSPIICASRNFIRSVQGKGNTFLTFLQKPVHHLLCIKEESKPPQLILLSLAESDYFAHILAKYQPAFTSDGMSRQITLIEPHGALLQSGKGSWENPFESPTKDNEILRFALIETMFIKGDAMRLRRKPYIETLQAWLESQPPIPKRLLKELWEEVLHHRPDDHSAFEKSVALRKLFASAC